MSLGTIVPRVLVGMALVVLAPLADAADTALDAQVGDFAKLLKTMDPSEAGKRHELSDAITAANPQLAPKLWRSSIAKAHDDAERKLQRLLAPAQVAKTAEHLLPDLTARRQAAFAIIRDEQKYPYPSPTHTGQKEVDELVARLRELWDDPLTPLLAELPALAKDLPAMEQAVSDLDELDGYLARYPAKSETAKPPEKIALRQRFADAVQRAWYPKDWNLVFEANAQALYLNDEERKHLLVLGRYRLMFGLVPLESDVRLHLAAQGHSRDMVEKGFFAHESPVPGKKTPGDRAHLQGYDSPGWGENIDMGATTGQQAFDAWYHSSGHHRNMLGAGFTQIGVGQWKRDWTQLFGALPAFAISKEKKPPTVAYLEQSLALGDQATVDQRLQLATQAANLKLWSLAKDQLQAVLKTDPANAKAQQGLKAVEAMGQ